MLRAPDLPYPRGPLSSAVLALLTRTPDPSREVPDRLDDVTDDDLHLALYVLYELHYRGWSGVDAELEWDGEVLALRRRIEARFEHLLREIVPVRPAIAPDATADLLRDAIAASVSPSLSRWVERHGQLDHLQELAVHRSPYQLKEADPHTWAIPRLPAGAAKSALLRLQLDEYGNGRPGATHAELFAATMRSLDLDDGYGAYLDDVPGVTLATVNLLSMFGLHRRWVGACVGHLAVFEMTSVVPMTRYAAAHRRVGGDAGAEFYDVHVAADADHELIASNELVPALVRDDPDLSTDVLFGADALLALEQRFAEHVLGRWTSGASSLNEAPSLARAS
jgi:hypothetical protein